MLATLLDIATAAIQSCACDATANTMQFTSRQTALSTTASATIAANANSKRYIVHSTSRTGLPGWDPEEEVE